MKKITLVLITFMVIFTIQTISVVAMPGVTEITTNKNSYIQFETVTVTLKANSGGGLPIDHFKVWASYDYQGYTDYAYSETDLPATFIGGTIYQETFNFQVAKGNKYVYIEALAFDSESRPGPEGQKIIYVEQQTSSEDNEPYIYNNQDQQSNQQSDNSSIFLIGFLIVIILLLIIIVIMILTKKK